MAEGAMNEMAGQMPVPEPKTLSDKFFIMRDGAVCGDIAEINKPCCEAGEAVPRPERVTMVTQGTSPEGFEKYCDPEAEQNANEDDNESYVDSEDDSLEEESSYLTVESYFSHKFLQDILALMCNGSYETDWNIEHEPLDQQMVETYKKNAERVYAVICKHIDGLTATAEEKLAPVRQDAASLDIVRKIQVQLYADTVVGAMRQLRRVAMQWTVFVLTDMAATGKRIPKGFSEQYLFCRIVSGCLKLRDAWWKTELYLAKYFLRFLNRCQGLSDVWQCKLQEVNLSVLRCAIEVHEKMDNEIGLWKCAQTVRFPARKLPAMQLNVINIFVDEQLNGDVASLMTLFFFETGSTVYKALFTIQEEFERRQLHYDRQAMEAEVRSSWAKYLGNVYDQCTNLGANKALYSLNSDPTRIGEGLRFYMDLVTPLHKAVTQEWMRSYSAIVEQLKASAPSPDVDQVAAWVEYTGKCVLDGMQSAFESFEKQVQVITKNVEAFSVEIRKILE
ncbi:uncharacterized protein LOC135370695 isoform X3 [Ornithodoros turicata]|uniref:uncharacterized protein LOC135370695 isoform X3 n=1 Tax=Ornithodoros turicata TaxID=34597 RepID=UPI003138A256